MSVLYFYYDARTGRFTRDITYKLESAKDRAQKAMAVVTVYAASGFIFPSKIIYPADKVAANEKNLPKNWYHGLSATGALTSYNLLYYIKKLNDHLKATKAPTPIILYSNDVTAEISYEVLKYCNNNLIILFNLRSDETFIYKMNEMVISHLQLPWEKHLQELKRQDEFVTAKSFAKNISICFNLTFNQEIVVRAFHICGIFPFNCNGSYTIDLGCGVLGRSESEDSCADTKVCAESKSLLHAKLSNGLLQKFKDTRKSKTPWKGDPAALYLYNFWCLLHGDDVEIENS